MRRQTTAANADDNVNCLMIWKTRMMVVKTITKATAPAMAPELMFLPCAGAGKGAMDDGYVKRSEPSVGRCKAWKYEGSMGDLKVM